MGMRNGSSMLARVVKAPKTDEQLTALSERNRRGHKTRRRRELERLIAKRKAERWAGRHWRPGKLTGDRPVRILVLEALDGIAWRTYAQVRERAPAASETAVKQYLFQERKAGRVEARVDQPRPRRWSYRLTRAGVIWLANQKPRD